MDRPRVNPNAIFLVETKHLDYHKQSKVGRDCLKMAQMGIDEFEKHFEAWYQRYWRHVGKQDAKKAYSARLKAGDTPQFLLEKLEQDYQLWRPTEDWERWRILLHPATWLNGRRWEDEPPCKSF